MFNQRKGLIIFIILSLAVLSMGSVSAATANSMNSTINSSDSHAAATLLKTQNLKKATDSQNLHIYVSTNGNDETGNGSADNPYKSLKYAITNAVNGSTIYLYTGTYSGVNNTKLTIDKTINISSQDGTATMDGKGVYNFFMISSIGNLQLDGLKFINGNDGTDSTAGSIINYGQLNLKNSVFTNNKGFLSGAVLSYGNLTVINSTFKSNNCTNYAGGIANFGTATITNSQFTQNNGNALYNNGFTTVISSNFTSNYINCDNFNNNPNSITITDSKFNNAGISSKGNTITIINSSFTKMNANTINLEYSNATIKGSSWLSQIYVGTNSTLNISYSALSYVSTGINATVNANYNWWGSNRLPALYNINLTKWVILTFTSDKTPIPSKTDTKVTVLFKWTDGKNIYDLTNYLPAQYVSFDTDNGYFADSSGYLINNSFSTTYLDNTEDTWIYAGVSDQKVRLVVGTGWTNYSIYVSNDGDDYYGDGSKTNPYQTLQKALSKALNGNKIYLFPGTYTGFYNSDLYINKYLTFSAIDGNVLIYRYSNLNLFTITQFGQINLNKINICSNMSYNVDLFDNDGVMVLNNCTISNSSGCIKNNGVSKIYDSTFFNIVGYVVDSTNDLTIVNSYFTNINIPVTSYNYYDREVIRSDGNLTVINSTFINNNLNAISADGDSNSYVLINGTNFINNTGGVEFSRFNFGVVDNCKFINNTQSFLGSCVRNARIINNSTFINNTGSAPTVIIGDYYDDINAVISNSTFLNNSSIYESYEDYDSNGIVFNGGDLKVDHCVFLGNSASYGGAIYNVGNLNVTYSVFVNNSAKYLANDVYNRMGTAYLLFNWWGSNSGPVNGKIYKLLGDVYSSNWVIMTLNAKGNVVNAALDKVTDINGTITNLGSVLPSRAVVFTGVGSTVSPENGNLVNNHAFTTITSDSTKDFIVKAMIDNQIVDLTIRNNSTMIGISNAIFYGKNNSYKLILSNVNGYLISKQLLKCIIKDKNGKSVVYNLTTDDHGVVSITINKPIGVYTVNVTYAGDGYFTGSHANAVIQVLMTITKLISYNQTFYGQSNLYSAYLYDVNGRGVGNQRIIFNISNGIVSKTYSGITDDQGRATVFVNLSQGKYNIKSSFSGDSWFGSSSSKSSFTINPTKTVLTIVTKYLYGRGNSFIVKLKDGKGNVVKNSIIALTFSQNKLKKTFNIKTNGNGTAGITVNLYPGTYNVTAKYNGTRLYKSSSNQSTLKISKVDTKLRADPVISNFNNSYNVLLTDIYNRPLAGETINFKIISPNLNATYSRITNNNGIANLLINLDIGNYVIIDSFNKNSWYNSTTTASAVYITNITAKNWFVYNYMTNSQIQHIFDNSPASSNVIFMEGNYNRLSLKISKPVNIKANGAVILRGSGSGVALTINSKCSIQGLIIKNYTTGILNRVNNVTVTNNTFQKNVNGLINYGSGAGVKINTVNVFNSNTYSGISNYGNNVTFKWLKLLNNRIGFMNRGLNVDILNNTLIGGQYGVMNYVSSSDLKYNKISGASKVGIYNVGLNARIGHNTLVNGVYGVYNGGSGSVISYNTISGKYRGVENHANSTTIISNTIKSVTSYGVYNTGSKNKIYNNILTGKNDGYGIYNSKTSKSTVVQSNIVSMFNDGVYDGGYKNNANTNTLKLNKIGFYVSNLAKYSQLVDNKIYQNKNYGVYNKGSNSTLYKNQIINNLKYGLVTVKSFKSIKNTIKGNKINKTMIK
ncbi:MAG: hypothetical protein NKF70_02400 [Methanobacterium sp. ERen5]|nr:MAG: hypothetical protein NKF70_02400 [Methanobacterium sp. ERen5]